VLSSGEHYRFKETSVSVNVGEYLGYLREYLLGKVSESAFSSTVVQCPSLLLFS
jgi:hypothetical protein